MANGRVFYLGFGVGLFLLGGIKIISLSWKRVFSASFLIPTFSAVALIGLVVYKTSAFFNLDSPRRLLKELKRVSVEGSTFWEKLIALDVYRASHMRVMVEAWLDHFWTGTGLGTFAMNYGEYIEKVWKGLATHYDNPSSMYLMILSEMGMPGLILMLVFLTTVTLIAKRFLILKSENFKTTLLLKSQYFDLSLFVIGAFIGLSATFLIGIHFVFPIIALLFVFILAFCIVEGSVFSFSLKHHLPVFLACFSVVYGMSAISCFFRDLRTPGFRWKETGKPQIPLPLVVPHISGLPEGQWMTNRSEILIFQKSLKIYTGPKERKFPFILSYELRSNENKILNKGKMQINKAQWISFDSLIQKTDCLNDVNYKNYCSLLFNFSSPWVLNRQKVGYFIEKSNLPYFF